MQAIIRQRLGGLGIKIQARRVEVDKNHAVGFGDFRDGIGVNFQVFVVVPAIGVIGVVNVFVGDG